MPDLEQLLRDTGGFGRYQVRLCLLSFATVVAVASQNLSVVFTAIAPRFGCRPEDNGSAELAPNSSAAACAARRNGSCSELQFDASEMDSTLVTKFALVCDRTYLLHFVSTAYMLGFLVGSSAYGHLSDHVGRVPALAAAGGQAVVFAVVAAVVPNYAAYVVCRALLGVGTSGALTVGLTFPAECVPARHRTAVIILLSLPWSLCMFLLLLLTHLLRSQTSIELTLAGLQAVAVGLVLLCHESPRWLLVSGRERRARHVLRSIAKVNGASFEWPKAAADAHLLALEEAPSDAPRTDSIIASFFRPPGMRRVTFALWFAFFTVSLVFYGLAYRMTTLAGLPFYARILLGSSIELVATLCLFPAAMRVPRLWFLVAVYGGIAVVSLAVVILTGVPGADLAITVLCCVAKPFASFIFNLATIYAVEVYPTSHRTFGTGLCSAAARVGSMLASQLVALGEAWPPGPYLCYGAASAVVVVLLLCLPETMGRPIPQEMAEAEQRAEHRLYRHALSRCAGREERRNSSE